MEVSLISITPEAEKQIAYCARVSSGRQDNPDIVKLLRYCIKHKHWSIFEQASMTVEIVTSRAIAQQILRHRSFCFQEFSQRYSESTSFEVYEARRQDTKNRQNSIDDMTIADKDWYTSIQEVAQKQCLAYYQEALARGIAKEQARFLLPLSTTTKLYMTGNLRNWIHYLEVRTDVATQKEHRDIADQIEKIMGKEVPIIWKAWRNVAVR